VGICRQAFAEYVTATRDRDCLQVHSPAKSSDEDLRTTFEGPVLFPTYVGLMLFRATFDNLIHHGQFCRCIQPQLHLCWKANDWSAVIYVNGSTSFDIAGFGTRHVV